MIASSRPSLVWGSVASALAMLALGVVLIRKDTPAESVSRVRFPPAQAPESGPNTHLVAGVGIVEPAEELVSIGSQLSGVIAAVPAHVGDLVDEGTPLIILDSRTAQSAVQVSRAEVRAQQARLKELRAEVESRQAKVAAAAASVKQSAAARAFAERELRRVESLKTKGAATPEEIELRRLNLETEALRWETSQANEREARANLALLDDPDEAPSIVLQEAVIAEAEAAARRDEVQLELHTIRAPQRCRVLQVKCHPGEYLASTPSATAAMVVGVTDPLHVRVEIDEADIPRFSDTANAYAVVRGRGDRKVPLSFVRREPLVIPKTNLAGGQRERIDTRVLEVIYSVTQEELGATVGQLVDVYLSSGDQP
jgi:HlyD family secretion protein